MAHDRLGANMPGLRNEDYVAFLDESGDEVSGVITVAGIFIPARWLRAAENRWRTFIRHELGRKSGRREVKSRELVSGSGASLDAQRAYIAHHGQPISANAAGRHFYKQALEHIAMIAECRVLAVGIRTAHAEDVYRLWFWLAYIAHVQRGQTPRPRLALSVIDGEDLSFRHAQDLILYRFYKRFRGIQTYVQSGNAWFVGGSVHQDSKVLPFTQMSDLLAGAARRAIVGGKYSTWYDIHLKQLAEGRGREVEMSDYALSLLSAADPADTSRCGYANALIP